MKRINEIKELEKNRNHLHLTTYYGRFDRYDMNLILESMDILASAIARRKDQETRKGWSKLQKKENKK